MEDTIEIINKKLKEKREEMNTLTLALRDTLKNLFWNVKGYTKKDTQNSAIIEDSIDFTIDMLIKYDINIKKYDNTNTK